MDIYCASAYIYKMSEKKRGPGRPALPDELRKKNILEVPLSDSELEKIRTAATTKYSGNTAKFVRTASLDTAKVIDMELRIKKADKANKLRQERQEQREE